MCVQGDAEESCRGREEVTKWRRGIEREMKREGQGSQRATWSSRKTHVAAE